MNPDRAAALGGPDWLQQRRVAAAERAAASSLPSTDEEVWRYSRIADLDLSRFSFGAIDAAAGVPEGLQALLDAVPDRAGLVVVRDGRIVHSELEPRWAAKGVVLGDLSAAEGAEGILGSVAGEATDLFGQLNDAFSADPVLVRVPPGVTVEGPMVVAHWTETPSIAVLPRLVVQAGADAEVRVLDIQASPDGVEVLVVPFVELDAGSAARLHYCNLQVLGDRTWQIASQSSTVAAQATLRSFTGAFGGEYARLRTDCRLAGQGSTGDLYAAYFGTGDQTLDFRTFQDHAAADTTSTLLFKGAVDDRSRSVYTGLIQVRPNARGTNAFQTNRNVKLSPDAWAESVPNLQIENNDVHCSHASTVGPIDEDQRFYLESRGVPPEVAERLIVSGFFDDVLAGVSVPFAESIMRDLLDVALGRAPQVAG
ncbi:MAG: SufD family Fe-S cluster assembly protein [Acidimicrobiia bacterium]|nr:SufD family Fe-S cluster assembly protein [Acidimicrobiia bacterium]